MVEECTITDMLSLKTYALTLERLAWHPAIPYVIYFHEVDNCNSQSKGIERHLIHLLVHQSL